MKLINIFNEIKAKPKLNIKVDWNKAKVIRVFDPRRDIEIEVMDLGKFYADYSNDEDVTNYDIILKNPKNFKVLDHDLNQYAYETFIHDVWEAVENNNFKIE